MGPLSFWISISITLVTGAHQSSASQMLATIFTKNLRPAAYCLQDFHAFFTTHPRWTERAIRSSLYWFSGIEIYQEEKWLIVKCQVLTTCCVDMRRPGGYWCAIFKPIRNIYENGMHFYKIFICLLLRFATTGKSRLGWLLGNVDDQTIFCIK